MIEERTTQEIEDDRLLRKQMGILGTQMIFLNENMLRDRRVTETQELAPPPSQYSSFGQPRDIDRGTSTTSVVEEIRGYRTDISNFTDSLSEIEVTATYEAGQRENQEAFFSPLIDVLNRHKLEYDSREVVKRRSLELHFGNIMGALSSSDGDGTNLLITLRRWYNDFFWNFSKAAFSLVGSVAKSMIGAVDKGLFGKAGFLGALGLGKDRRTDSQKIVDSIKQQTEYFLTGKIDQTRGFVKQMKQFGIIGSTTRALGNVALAGIGISRERNQANVIDRAAGVSKDRSGMGTLGKIGDALADTLSKRIYDPTTVKYGKIQQIEAPKADANTPILEDQLKISISTYGVLRDMSGEVSRTRDALVADVMSGSMARDVREAIAERRKDADTLEFREMLLDGNKSIIGNTKSTANEVRKHRRQSFYMRAMGLLSNMAKGLGSLLVNAGSMLLKIGSIAAGLFGIKALLDKIPGIPKRTPTARPDPSNPRKRTPKSSRDTSKGASLKKKSGRALIAGSIIKGVASVTDEETRGGAIADTVESAFDWSMIGTVVGGALGAAWFGTKGAVVGAALGGPMGAVVGGGMGIAKGAATGSAIGMKMGAAYGLGKGVWDNRDGLLHGKREPTRHGVEVPVDFGLKTNLSDFKGDTSDRIRGDRWKERGGMMRSDYGSSIYSNLGEKRKEAEKERGILDAIQESIQMPINYIKDLYENTRKESKDSTKAIEDGNSISAQMATTLKEISTKLTKEDQNPFGNMFTPGIPTT